MRWFLGFDIVSVLLFVVVGRTSHDEEVSLAGAAGTAAPFLIALAAAWLAARAWQAPLSWPTALWVWSVTAAGGMLLRRLAFGDSTAATFVIIGAAFLGVFLVGWRALVMWARSG